MGYTVSGFGLKNKSLVVGRAVRALGARAKASAQHALHMLIYPLL